jgi:hypothetical protein
MAGLHDVGVIGEPGHAAPQRCQRRQPLPHRHDITPDVRAARCDVPPQDACRPIVRNPPRLCLVVQVGHVRSCVACVLRAQGEVGDSDELRHTGVHRVAGPLVHQAVLPQPQQAYQLDHAHVCQVGAPLLHQHVVQADGRPRQHRGGEVAGRVNVRGR